MSQGIEEPASEPSVIEVHPITLQEEPSNIPAALHEDKGLLRAVDAEITKRRERVAAARTLVGEKRQTLWQAQTRQDTARGLYVLSKNMMEQIRREGQLKSPQQSPRDTTSRHGRSLSSMDQSRQALVDRTVETLRDAIAELQAASSDLVIAQKNVATAEGFLGYAERALAAAVAQIDLMRTFIGEEEMKIRPTPTLPDSVWRRIFIAAVANEGELPPVPQDIFQEWNYTPVALSLSHVNREWRRIATSTPPLWTKVQIVFTKERRLRHLLFHRILGLAGGAPLSVAVTLTADVGSIAGQLADAFTDDHQVQSIKIQTTDFAASGVRYLLEALPAARQLEFRGLTVPMGNNPNPVKIPSKHIMSATDIRVSNLVLERLPPFFFVPPPPWHMLVLHTDIPSLLRIDIGATAAPSMKRLEIFQITSVEHCPPWYETAVGISVENAAAKELIIHPMSRGHMGTLIQYICRLRFITRLELHGASVQPILMTLKENTDAAQKVWFPSLSSIAVHDYEQHGQALGMFVAARLDLAQRSLREDIGNRVQPLREVTLYQCPNFSDEIRDLIEQHCDAGRRMAERIPGETSPPPQSS